MDVPLFILFGICIVLTLSVVCQATREAKRSRSIHKHISGTIERNMKK